MGVDLAQSTRIQQIFPPEIFGETQNALRTVKTSTGVPGTPTARSARDYTRPFPPCQVCLTIRTFASNGLPASPRGDWTTPPLCGRPRPLYGPI